MKPRFQKPRNGGRRSRRTITKVQSKQTTTATPEAKKKRVAIPATPIERSVLPIPDRPPIGLTTYDAKDPDTQYPPIEPLRPTHGCPKCPRRPDRRCRLWGIFRVRRPVPDAYLRKTCEGRSQIQSLPHHGSLLSHTSSAPHRTQPSFGGHGRHYRNGYLGTGPEFHAAEYGGATC
jgi:hypothetical protein